MGRKEVIAMSNSVNPNMARNSYNDSNVDSDDIYTFSCIYAQHGLHTLPLRPRTKEVILNEWKPYQEKAPSQVELELWFKGKSPSDVGIAVILGGGIIGIDFDKPELMPFVIGEKDPRDYTWVARTDKGIHIYLRADNIKNNVEISGVVELKAKNKYLVTPPSIHPSGTVYKWESDIKKTSIFKLNIEQEKELINRIHFLKKNWKLIEILNKAWKVGQRNQIALYTSGVLYKSGWTIEDAENLLWILCLLNDDHEEYNRLGAIESTYSKDVSEVAGISKLEELLSEDDINKIKKILKSNNIGSNSRKITDVDLLDYIEMRGMFFKSFNNVYYYYHRKNNDVIPIESDGFDSMIFNIYRKLTGNIIKKTYIENLRRAGKAIAYDNPKDTFLRVGWKGKNIYYDLGTDNKIIRINSDGWDIINELPEDFFYVRTPNFKNQAIPIYDPNFDIDVFLKTVFNLKHDSDFKLLKVWLVASLICDIPRPLVNIYGSEGSGKTKFLEFLKKIIDPGYVLTHGLKDERDRDLTIYQSYFTAFDNLSFIDTKKTYGEVSNDISRFITGQGKTERKLFTNREQEIFTGVKLIGMNGINQLVRAPDLADRTLNFELNRISEDERKLEKFLNDYFEENLRYVLGWIFNALSKSMNMMENENIQPKNLPRMSDFGMWGYVISEVIGWSGDEFLSCYKKKTFNLKMDLSNDDILVNVIKHFIFREKEWCGYASDLLKILKDEALSLNVEPDRLPSSPNLMGRKINTFKVVLNEIGIDLVRKRTRYGNLICFKMIGDADYDVEYNHDIDKNENRNHSSYKNKNVSVQVNDNINNESASENGNEDHYEKKHIVNNKQMTSGNTNASSSYTETENHPRDGNVWIEL